MRTFWREKVRPWWYDYEWPVLGAVAVVLLALGYYGFLLHHRAANKTPYFFGLLNRAWSLDLLPGGTHERLGRLLHEDYVTAQRTADQTAKDNVALLPWDELSAEFKESNLQEADYIWVKLGAVGCRVKPLASRAAAQFQFTSEEIETMARLEHERWMSERRMQGWNHGPNRDDQRKLNSNLQAWDRLSDVVREYNRQTIRNLPALLARAQLQIQRREM